MAAGLLIGVLLIGVLLIGVLLIGVVMPGVGSSRSKQVSRFSSRVGGGRVLSDIVKRRSLRVCVWRH
jgi:hypothetical protein